ncbi:MAG: flagellar filament capping protein FliD [Magnetococcales bacterium]|nr:flagellar filament capping protein FliD [Magnetococcales bacterium]MBF0149267.1 flagellar filament capping protein FliD [Magnetococcales bacterium]MBF0172800.1 flagellar filament capping protein FliD [Magnetococcales bacterium]MBF0632175.1 flagellar filament capping protein FliD [Magnetococcales bacterium]
MALGNITFGGLASGLPSDMVDQLLQVEQKRLTSLKADKADVTKKKTALSELGSKLSALASTASSLQTESSWSPHTAASSDTDKVAVTASYKAVAGTHTLEVSRLASSQTMMTAAGVTDSADTISAITDFSFSYNGVAYTNADFGIAVGDTMADVASKISSTDFGDDKGVSAGVLYDGSNYRLVLTAKDQGAQSRNSDGTTATTRLTGLTINMTWDTSGAAWDTTAATGNTAAVSSSTNAMTDSTATVTVGTAALSFDYDDGTGVNTYNNGDEFTIAAGDTLSDIADRITNLNISGLKASVVSDGYQNRLVIDGSSAISNLTSNLEFANGGGTGVDSTISSVAWNAFQTDIGLDAKMKVDGLSNIYSSSNTVEDVLPGVTMTLKETTASAITVTVTDDTAALKTTLTSFTTSFNDVIDYINQNKAGALSGATLTRSIISQLRNELNSSTDKDDASGNILSPFSILAEMGLRTDQKTGKISFDSDELDSALSSNFTVLSDLFTNTQTEVGANNSAGLAHRIEDLLDNITNSTTGSLTGVKDSVSARISNLEKSIEREEARLEKVREMLTKKFSNLEQLVNSMNSQGTALTSALGKL